jgi:hypothetical protein
MTLPQPSVDRTLQIYLSLAQYPILRTQIRALMRRELFNRGVIQSQAFEAEVRDKAIQSQVREGLNDPYGEEPGSVWERRLFRVREHLTDFYFAYNLPYELFEDLVREVLGERGAAIETSVVNFNSELAPQEMLFEQAQAIEKLPAAERQKSEARLQEIKVVLIRTLISDQLGYVNIAKDWFTIDDLIGIRSRKIGDGKIGGKSAGMLLAARILNDVGDDEIRSSLRIPESYYLGADLTYIFKSHNGLTHWAGQKYKTGEQIRIDYLEIQEDFEGGQFPPDIMERLAELLDEVKRQPIIVRSSSLLEDNFGTSFAGKYESHFCPNQGTPRENLRDLMRAIARIYASIYNPDALLYRRARGLQDYDERMALLIQVVQGERFGRYFLPHAAGVGFSRNVYRWSPKIGRDEGFLRMVWGLGTRAVERVGNDYARLVALSHPLLHPESNARDVHRYSQHFVDLIDLEDNQFKTLPIEEVLTSRYAPLRFVAQVDEGGYLVPLRSAVLEGDISQLVLTFDELFRRTDLAERMRRMLQLLERHYNSPVDTEFTIQIVNPLKPRPEIRISLLQCRPQSHFKENEVEMPADIPGEAVIFTTCRVVPKGHIHGIRYVLFVSPEGYYQLPTAGARAALSRCIGQLNVLLAREGYIAVGPGRWGTSNPDLGVAIGYADIYNTAALVELAGEGVGLPPEPSFGTHFFQDLVEANIYPLAIHLDDEEAVFNRDFFYNTPNRLLDFLPDEAGLLDTLRVIEVASFRPGHHLELVMDEAEGCAVAFLSAEQNNLADRGAQAEAPSLDQIDYIKE